MSPFDVGGRAPTMAPPSLVSARRRDFFGLGKAEIVPGLPRQAGAGRGAVMKEGYGGATPCGADNEKPERAMVVQTVPKLPFWHGLLGVAAAGFFLIAGPEGQASVLSEIF